MFTTEQRLGFVVSTVSEITLEGYRGCEEEYKAAKVFAELEDVGLTWNGVSYDVDLDLMRKAVTEHKWPRVRNTARRYLESLTAQ